MFDWPRHDAKLHQSVILQLRAAISSRLKHRVDFISALQEICGKNTFILRMKNSTCQAITQHLSSGSAYTLFLLSHGNIQIYKLCISILKYPKADFGRFLNINVSEMEATLQTLIKLQLHLIVDQSVCQYVIIILLLQRSMLNLRYQNNSLELVHNLLKLKMSLYLRTIPLLQRSMLNLKYRYNEFL